MSSIKELHTANIIKDFFTFKNADSSTGYLGSVKAIPILLILLCHLYVSRIMIPFKNGENLQKYTTEILYQCLGQIPIIMDVFFFTGGFLTAMSLQKGLDAPYE